MNISILESYLLKSPEEALSKLVEGTDEYYFLYFLNVFKKHGFNLDEKQRLQLSLYCSQFNSDLSESIKLRALFLEYDQLSKDDSQENTNKKFQLIKDTIPKMFHLNYDVEPSPNLNKISDFYQNQQQHQLQYVLDEKQIDIQKIIDQSYDDVFNFQQFKSQIFHKLNLKKLSESKLENIKYFIQNVGFDIVRFKGIPEFYIKVKERFNMESQYNLLLNKMSVEQLMTTLQLLNNKDDPQLFQTLFRLKNVENQNLIQLYNFYQWLLEIPNMKQYQYRILKQYLNLSIKQNQYDFSLFVEYLSKQTKLDQEDKYIRKNYLIRYINEQKDINIIEQYFDKEYLLEKQCKIKLMMGCSINKSSNFLKTEQIEQLQKKKVLQFCNYNKTEFDYKQPIKLFLQIKNIHTLFINVYEVNTVNCHLNGISIDNLQFDCQQPLQQMRYIYNEPSILKKTYEFQIDYLTQRERGIFFIEFIGDGLVRKIKIRKGSLTYKKKITPAGYALTIFNENNEICLSNDTKACIDNNIFPINQTTQEIIIPFSESEEQTSKKTLILINNGFAELFQNFELQPEQFRLEISVIVPNESIFQGQQVKALIFPRLFINDQQISLNLIKQGKIELKWTVEQEFLNQICPIENINDEAPIEFEFLVDKYTTSYTFSLQCEVNSFIKEKLTINSNNYKVDLNYYEDCNILYIPYLHYSEDKLYQILILGKNGERKSGINCSINVKLFHYDNNIHIPLTSDQNGVIHLGQLINCQKLSCTITSGWRTTHNWDLSIKKQNYPQFITSYINQEICLLYSGQINDLLLINQNSNLNCSDKIICLNNKMKISINELGNYYLIILSENILINIEIIQSDQQQSDNIEQIFNNNFYIEQSYINKQITISNIKQEFDLNTNSTTISGQIEGNSESGCQIFCIMNTFIDSNQQILIEQIEKGLNSTQSIRCHHPIQDAQYQTIDEVDSELQYILDRTSQENQAGHILQKPQLILKRQKIRDTQMKEIQQFNQQQNKTLTPQLVCSELIEKSQKIPNRMKKKLQSTNESFPQEMGQIVQTFQEFLQNKAKVLVEIQVNGNEFQFQVPNCYSNVQLFIFNKYYYQYQLIGLKNYVIQCRDMKYKSKFNPNQVYYINRQSKSYTKGNIELINYEMTNFKLVNSLKECYLHLENIHSYLKDRSRNNESLTDWEFLINWNKYNVKEKQEYYNQYSCNEFNLFLYYKDRTFFEEQIKSFLACKLEKDLIDYFLLGQQEQIYNYSKSYKLKDLNALELTLLVIYFSEYENNKKEAKLIYDQMVRLIQHHLQDDKLYYPLFDSVIGLNFHNQQDSIVQDIVKEQKYFLQRRGGARTKQTARMSMGGQRHCRNYNSEYEKLREKYRQSYENVKSTVEYGEEHYYSQNKNQLIPINQFWIDLAKHSIEVGLEKEPFLSSNFIYCHLTVSSILCVLSFLSLNWESTQIEPKIIDGKFTILNNKPTILFMQEIKFISQPKLKDDVIVLAKVYELQDKFVDETNQIIKEVTEFTFNKIYGCTIIVSNCSSTNKSFQLIFEIPQGSLPAKSKYTRKQQQCFLQPYTSSTINYYFYFPEQQLNEQFEFCPVSVLEKGKVVQKYQAKIYSLRQDNQLKQLNNLKNCLEYGNRQDLINFISNTNIEDHNKFDIYEISYLLLDKSFYNQVQQILRAKKQFIYELSSYSIIHQDHEGLQEFLNTQDAQQYLKNHLNYFSCSLFTINTIKYLDYFPIINKRVHRFGDAENQILIEELEASYFNALFYMIQKDKLELSDKLCLTYYLILQERINEAIQIFQSITEPPKDGECQLQYDYFTAYLDFYIGYPNFIKARQICEKYINYPVIHWRNLFYEIVNQLSEYDGDDDENQKIQVEQTKQKKQQEQAKKEEILQSAIEGNQIVITYSNLQAVKIQFYKIDLEILFSRNPFLNQATEDFSYVLPNSEIVRKLQAEQQAGMTYKEIIEIPEDLKQFNMFIQINGLSKNNYDIQSNTKRISLRYFPSRLNVMLMENNGKLRVTNEEGKYLSKIYIKVFVKDTDGIVSFYKDGYTDLRGRFDYAQLSFAKLETITKYAILAVSDNNGQMITYAQPPSRIGMYEDEIEEQCSKKTQKQQ